MTIIQIIEFSSYLLLFYLCFYFIFRKYNDFRFQRFYLISSLIICLIIPFLPFHNLFTTGILNINLSPIIIGPNAEMTSASISNSTINFDFVWILYFLISFIVFSRLIIGLIILTKLIFSNDKRSFDGYHLIQTKGIKSAFSFFNYVFVPKDNTMSKAALDIIIRHECLHIKLGHSFEKLFLEISKVFFWWHPAVHLMSISLNNVHEYEVDEIIIRENDKKTYSEFLINCISEQPKLLVNTISSNIKNRIIMMYSDKKTLSTASKILGIFTLVFISLFLHSCQKENKSSNVTTVPAEKTAKESNKFLLTNTDTIVTFDLETKKESIQIVTSETDVFKVVEQMPEFPGCEDIDDLTKRSDCSKKKMLQFVYTNIVYPAAAKKAGIEGMVVCSFIVDDQGYLSNEKILRSPNDDLGQAVLDMIEKMKEGKKWNPGVQSGKKVNVQYTLPVKFKLE